MCLILFAYRVDPDYPLILAANRDEFYGRPTLEAHYWPDTGRGTGLPGILAGKDEIAGGTWLGISDSGRFAAVTNIRNPAQSTDKPRSRGELPSQFLLGTQRAADYCQEVLSRRDDYVGFNLLVSDGEQLCYVNNRDGVARSLEPGIYGLSNAELDSNWPKVVEGKQRLTKLIESGAPSTDALLAMMADRALATDEKLPATGVPLAMERTLSATFILNKELNYGTRCSTALIVSNKGEYRFSESNFDSNGNALARHYFCSSTANSDSQAA